VLTGKFWLLPNGECVDVSDNEHAIYAKRVLLQLPEGSEEASLLRVFKPITAEEANEYIRRGVDKDTVNYLFVHADPRVLAIEKFNWIRVAKHNFDVWTLDYATLNRIRYAGYWHHQVKASPGDVASLYELSTQKTHERSLCSLLQCSPEAIISGERTTGRRNA